MLTRQTRLMDEQQVRALADPLRMRIVDLLASEQLCTCHLVEALGATQTNVSNHLRVLRNAGLIQSEPAGRYTYHRLDPERLADLAGTFTQLAMRAGQAAALRRPCA
jgi:ArsR family transcriptional regulator